MWKKGEWQMEKYKNNKTKDNIEASIDVNDACSMNENNPRSHVHTFIHVQKIDLCILATSIATQHSHILYRQAKFKNFTARGHIHTNVSFFHFIQFSRMKFAYFRINKLTFELLQINLRNLFFLNFQHDLYGTVNIFDTFDV